MIGGNGMEHILLCGRRRSGRSAMIRRLLANTRTPAFGYETRTTTTRPDGYHEIYLFPYGTEPLEPSAQNHAADCNTRDRIIYTEVFDTLGVAFLNARTDGIIVMDEIGFMESDAEVFCRTVLEKLDGNLPVLAAVREGMETDFLRRVKAHPSARVIRMQPEYFEEIYTELLPIVSQWDKLCRERER